MRRAGLVSMLIAVSLGLVPGVATAADAPALQPVVQAAAPVSAANPQPPEPSPIVGRVDAGRRLFTSICVYCHHLDDGVSAIGAPGLKGAFHRYGEAWLERWLADPQGFADSDAKASALIAANPYGQVMPTLPTMQDAQNRADVIAFMKSLDAGDGKGKPPAQ